MLRLCAPFEKAMLREVSEMERLSNALFNPANWGRDIVSRETASLRNPVRQTPDGSWKMEIYIDAHKFKPSEVSIKTKEGRITVEGARERQNADGSFRSLSQFRRVFPIPEGVDKKAISAQFTEEGGLVLEAPAAAPKPSEAAVECPASLPITHQ